MQGCPYDALYIDPATETAAKCNFCAHKVEVGLEPPCVTVCPTQAIVAGDLDDASSRIAQMSGASRSRCASPRRARRPKVFYVEADAAALVPGGRASRPPITCGRRRRRCSAFPACPHPTPRALPAAPTRSGAAPQFVGMEGVRLSLDEVAGRGRFPRSGRPRVGLPWRSPVPERRTRDRLLALATTGRCSSPTSGSRPVSSGR
jgi:hypothetical protein